MYSRSSCQSHMALSVSISSLFISCFNCVSLLCAYPSSSASAWCWARGRLSLQSNAKSLRWQTREGHSDASYPLFLSWIFINRNICIIRTPSSFWPLCPGCHLPAQQTQFTPASQLSPVPPAYQLLETLKNLFCKCETERGSDIMWNYKDQWVHSN